MLSASCASCTMYDLRKNCEGETAQAYAKVWSASQTTAYLYSSNSSEQCLKQQLGRRAVCARWIEASHSGFQHICKKAAENIVPPCRGLGVHVTRVLVYGSAQAGFDQNHYWIQGGPGYIRCRHRLTPNSAGGCMNVACGCASRCMSQQLHMCSICSIA